LHLGSIKQPRGAAAWDRVD